MRKIPKYKVGQTVVCTHNRRHGGHGAGWKLGKKILIDTIEKYGDCIIYFPKHECGVYEEEVVLENNKLKELKKKLGIK